MVNWTEQFETLWQSHEADAFVFLREHNVATLDEKTNVLLAEQRLRHHAGTPRAVADYFTFATEIAGSATHKTQLLEAEYRLLQARGCAPDIHEFVNRFPDVHQALLARLPTEKDRSEKTVISHNDNIDDEGTGDLKARPSPVTNPTRKATKIHRSKTIDVPERAMAHEVPFGATIKMSGKTAASGAEASGLPPNHRINDRYLILRVLGEGGFGRVYLTSDEELRREVALKVPHQHRIETADARNEYFAEARIVANLDHPNIVPVYDIGQTPDGLCYIVSKRVDGTTLAAYTRDMRSSQTEIAYLIAQIADALHYAHLQGLVHRDIKPGNILVDAAGVPLLIDFGLALKEEDFGTGNTFLGTPSYMSPEQARGEGHLADGRSDIFSLGTVMYVLLTGTKPFKAKTVNETTTLVMRRDPSPLRVLDRTIPRELERICLRALEKRAVDRYMTALDMAEDLRVFLASQTEPAIPKTQTIQALEQSTTASTSVLSTNVVRVVPKGLRSFDGADADFFLALLPGAKDRDGLPNSIRFWKTLIAERDRNQTFRVGLLYGPSGCGKSSLVQAGLLPRLDKDVIPIYIESTGVETESRILNGIRKRCPTLGAEHDIVSAMSLIRRGKVIPSGQKIVLILDQFEQWLHAHAEEETEPRLVRALRQCDGENLQCLLMVRDDFWLAASRLMRELEVDQIEGRNMATVDLFDKLHARKVLIAFGRALERLPAAGQELSKEQNRFIEAAVDGLAEDGKVISVRISLFAEMFKGKDWTPATLAKLGGTEGVGVTFLEETFSVPTAPPAHRLHEPAVRRVLQALLPEEGSDIKGHMRSYSDLLKVSGYEYRPEEFRSLLQLLDNQLRLVTPTDPIGAAFADDSLSERSTTDKWYQLTHDYLVRSLREWLTNKQKESATGRAELAVREQAKYWSAKRERRRLPTVREWLTISALTDRKNWSEPQQGMMRAASRNHLTVCGIWLSIIAIVGYAGYYLHGHTRGNALIGSLMAANTSQLLPIVQEMAPYRRWTDTQLREILQETSPDSKEYFRASLALVPVDDSHVETLKNKLRTAATETAIVIRDAMEGRESEELLQWLRELLRDKINSPRARLNAAITLAAFAPPSTEADENWEPQGAFLAEQLATTVQDRPDQYANLREALRPAKTAFLPTLRAWFVEDVPDRSRRNAATSPLLDFAIGDIEALAALIIESDTEQFVKLYPLVEPHAASITQIMQRVLIQQCTPNASGEEQKRNTIQRSNAAFTLLRLGEHENVWPLLKHSPSPDCRAFLTHQMVQRKVNVQLPLTQLDRETNPSAIRALLLALGDYPFDALTKDAQQSIERRLRKMLVEDPDAGVHSATEWLLRKWNRTDALKSLGDIPRTKNRVPDRDWYITQGEESLGSFTMVVLDGRSDSGVGRMFEIATKEVSRRQFEAFAPHAYFNPERSLGPDCAAATMTWIEAVKYCQWLNTTEGIPPDQWCYPPVETITDKDDVALLQPDVTKTGYRLPTDAEWEFACKANAQTFWAFGNDKLFLPKYAWCGRNADRAGRIWPGGLKKPNDFGLFDMYGNVSEWMAELGDGSEDKVYQKGGGSRFSDENLDGLGGYLTPLEMRDSLGIRIARTSPKL